ncbi:MAG TPA: fused MFS/spermidine synthase, partial [Chloroflexota bacterium]|nr:fused MFS/spermidine synthase [Chloroflexota bacterium]
ATAGLLPLAGPRARPAGWRLPRPGRRDAVLLAFGLSGFCALAYEVIWFRLLSLFAFDNSTYAFTVMLATVLFGIAAGSYVVTPLMGRLSRRINWWIVFAALEWGIGVLAILSISVLANIDGVVKRLAVAWPALAPLTKADDGWMLLAAFVAIVPPMFLSGMTFPVAALLYTGKDGSGKAAPGDADGSRRIGTLYAANVVGAIAGSTLAGFVLLPQLASQQSLVMLSLGSVLAGGLVLWVAPGGAVGLLTKVAVTLAGGAVLLGVLRLTPNMYERLQPARFPGKEVVWYREGLESTVTVVRDPADGLITLYTNARGQARDEVPLVAFHRLLGHWPMLLHPRPERALIVGIGGGATSGAVAIHDGVHLDAVELSDAVIEAAHLFGHVNHRFYERPNVELVQNDARNHLLLSGRKYHVISGDAIRPNDAGAATLYSLEYYRLCAAALEEDGLMTQWLPPFSDYQYKLILRTFLAAFPYVTLWQDGDLLIGSKSPIAVDPAALARRFEDEQVRSDLTPAGVTTAEEFLRRFNASTEELRAVAGEGPVITDDRPYLEYFRSLPEDGPPDMTRYSRDRSQILK